MKQETVNSRPQKGNPFVTFLWVILIVLFLNWLIFPNLTGQKIKSTDYGTFIEKMEEGSIKEVMIKSGQIYFTVADKGNVTTYQTGEINDPQLVDRLLKAKSPNEDGKVAFTEIVPEENSPFLNFILMWVLPGLLFYVIGKRASRSIQARMGELEVILCHSGMEGPRFMRMQKSRRHLPMWPDKTKRKKC